MEISYIWRPFSSSDPEAAQDPPGTHFRPILDPFWDPFGALSCGAGFLGTRVLDGNYRIKRTLGGKTQNHVFEQTRVSYGNYRMERTLAIFTSF